VLSQHFPGWTEENYEKCMLGWPMSGPRFEPGTSHMQGRSHDYQSQKIIKYLKQGETFVSSSKSCMENVELYNCEVSTSYV
jgi:hypothetical protein